MGLNFNITMSQSKEPTTDQNPPQTVGERIKARREEKGRSLNQVADDAGISKSALHDLETKPNVRPSAELLYNVAEALDTTVAFLLGKRRNPLSDGEPVEIPESLAVFARSAKLTSEETRLLACIKYRGRQPKTSEDWGFIYQAIERSTPKPSE